MPICITHANGVILLLMRYRLDNQRFATTEFVVLSKLPLGYCRGDLRKKGATPAEKASACAFR